ncbi:alpha/beta fold hydrolase [Millisia brevis]|uniref:alpha/beta fold hydrolase n=1 Tax=Millisia brevis TaxID=264148 RepID=UPI000A73B00A|nr:alpha/beta fold hydrolase [Millisia brevis]
MRCRDRSPGVRRRWPVLLLVLVVVSVTVNLWQWWGGRDRIGQWRGADALAGYTRAYDAAMAGMPTPTEVRDVPVSYGTVRAYLFAPADPERAARTPIVLLPGWGSGTPMWSTNLPGLVAQRPVWAFDAIGDAGMSVQSAPIPEAVDQAIWVDETLAGLGVERAHIVGHSFGGWLATNLAVHRPQRVASLALLEPVQVVTGLRWQVIVSSIPATLPVLPQSWRDAALADIGGAESIDRDDPVTAMIAAGTAGYQPRRSFPARPSDAQLRALSMPVLLVMAGDSAVNSDPAGAVDRAYTLIPEVTASVVPGATHSLPMEQPGSIDAAILDLARDADRR